MSAFQQKQQELEGRYVEKEKNLDKKMEERVASLDDREKELDRAGGNWTIDLRRMSETRCPQH